MIFKPRQKRVSVKFRVILNNNVIEQVKEIVFVGVVFDEHLTWKPPIAHVANKISKSIGIIQEQVHTFRSLHCELCIFQ